MRALCWPFIRFLAAAPRIPEVDLAWLPPAVYVRARPPNSNGPALRHRPALRGGGLLLARTD